MNAIVLRGDARALPLPDASVGVSGMTCFHCGEEIVLCPMCRPDGPFNPFNGWRHVGYDTQPIGGHYCGGRSVNPIAAPQDTPVSGEAI